MNKPITFEVEADEMVALETALEACIAEMRRANERVRQDQIEIDKLKAETHEIAAETHLIAAETCGIAAKTRAMLTHLMATTQC